MSGIGVGQRVLLPKYRTQPASVAAATLRYGIRSSAANPPPRPHTHTTGTLPV